MQLEFVVDNKTLADIADGISAVGSSHYRAPLGRIRQRLFDLYKNIFEYKCGFLDPVDWRPRERNAAADYVANHVLYHGLDVDSLDEEAAAEILRGSVGLQIFSDGGYAGRRGAVGVFFFAVQLAGTAYERKLLGSRGYSISGCTSAFCAEVIGLDIATETAARLGKSMRRA